MGGGTLESKDNARDGQVCPGDQGDAEVLYPVRVVEMRWNSCGKMKTAPGETLLCSGIDEGESYERGGGLIVSKEAVQSLLE